MTTQRRGDRNPSLMRDRDAATAVPSWLASTQDGSQTREARDRRGVMLGTFRRRRESKIASQVYC